MKILGIDTSAYTTSLALIEKKEAIQLSIDQRQLLKVPLGQRGLRQSEAVFQHLKQLPELLSASVTGPLDAVAVSIAPRSQLGSYMPVFTVGQAFAQTVAAAKGVPLYGFSHQEGHIMAGLWSSNYQISAEPFLAIHISGGTSDVMAVQNVKSRLQVVPLGASQDLHAGQFVDRVGVLLGASFPAGATMDRWAQSVDNTTLRIPSHAHKYEMSFSGPASAAARMAAVGSPAEEIALSVFLCIARTLEKIIRYAYQKNNYAGVLIVGGVASNTHIRRQLRKRLSLPLYFASPKYSTDNAVGTALLGLEKYQEH